jgi:GNAT superfamily N-acetyltransferase
MYPEDRYETTATFGIHLDGAVVSVGTIMVSPYPGSGDEQAWRIRGMATEAPFRSRGFGGQILEALLSHAGERGGTRVWCNARVDAVPFYERFGFETRGEVFLTAGERPHVLMHVDRQQSWVPIHQVANGFERAENLADLHSAAFHKGADGVRLTGDQ